MSCDSLGTGNVNMRTATSHPVSLCVICCNYNYDYVDAGDHENDGDDNDGKDHDIYDFHSTSCHKHP